MWRTAAAPLQKSWEDSVRRVGQDPNAILADLKAKLAAYKAAF
jgi:hypothetical protein